MSTVKIRIASVPLERLPPIDYYSRTCLVLDTLVLGGFMNTVEYLQQAKKALNIESDYALAKALGVTRGAISSLMIGRTCMSDETAAKVATIIGKHAGIVILDMHRERAATPEQASIWNEIARGFLSLLMPAKGMTA